MCISCIIFKEWYDFYSSQQFKVMELPIHFLVQERHCSASNWVDYCQINYDVDLISKSPGVHPYAFKPEFCGNVLSPAVDGPSRYASSINVNSCKKMLTKPTSKASIYLEEKNGDLLI